MPATTSSATTRPGAGLAPARLLLTPGPLTTSARTRAALDRDWGSREADFIALSERLRARLAALAGVADSHVAVPIQGSGSAAVEATIQTMVPPDGRLLVLANGAYGRRAAEMARRAGRETVLVEAEEHAPFPPALAARALAAETRATDVLLVHCETTSGVLNPLGPIAALVADAGKRLLLDAMSSFGAIPIDGRETRFAALVASANKGLEGVPGIGIVIADRARLAACAGNAPAVTLDLHEQWRGFEANGQWRFTPPVQVVAALDAALDQLDAEGGVAARHARYAANCAALVAGMRERGFAPMVAAEHQAPVIVTFAMPEGFDFPAFYAALAADGVVIYPGKLTRAPSFRIGCIGAIDADDIAFALERVSAALRG